MRDDDLVTSAIAQPKNVHFYGGGDDYDIAAAYAFHIAENQAYVDGNKRTGLHAALVYLELNGVETERLSEDETYRLMIAISDGSATRADLADHLRLELSTRSE